MEAFGGAQCQQLGSKVRGENPARRVSVHGSKRCAVDDIQMKPAAADAALRPVIHFPPFEHPHQRQAAAAFGAVVVQGAQGLGTWRGFELRHDHRALRCRGADLFGPAPAMPEAIDVVLGVRDRRVLVGPGEADFEREKGLATDDQRLAVDAPDPRVPQPAPGLEGLDVVAVIKACHRTPAARSVIRTDHELPEQRVKPFT